jgi:hypothetical protein
VGREGHVFERGGFHVQIDKDPARLSGQQKRTQPRRNSLNRGFGVGGMNLEIESGKFDGYVDPGNVLMVVAINLFDRGI